MCEKKGTYLFYSAFTTCTSCRGRMNTFILSIITRTQRREKTAEGLLKTTVGSKQIEEGFGV